MSTRASVIIKDSFGDELIFYRHSDGYPEGTLPTLNKFLDMVKSGEIRDNAMQSAGWLIIIGHEEYADSRAKHDFNRWKVGAYEPAVEIYEDCEYLYTIDLAGKEITVKEL